MFLVVMAFSFGEPGRHRIGFGSSLVVDLTALIEGFFWRGTWIASVRELFFAWFQWGHTCQRSLRACFGP